MEVEKKHKSARVYVTEENAGHEVENFESTIKGIMVNKDFIQLGTWWREKRITYLYSGSHDLIWVGH